MSSRNSQILVAGIAVTAAVILGLWFLSKTEKDSGSGGKGSAGKDTKFAHESPDKPKKSSDAKELLTPLVSNKTREQAKDEKSDSKALHAKIEELDKKGKVLFKQKQVRHPFWKGKMVPF